MSKKLQNTTSIITGASRGIGRAIAILFAHHGSQCLLIGRDGPALHETKRLCSLRPSLRHSIKTGGVGSRDFWTSLDLDKFCEKGESGEMKGESGRTEGESSAEKRKIILVNAAGITHSSLLVRTSEAQIEEVMRTNLMGTLWASQVVGKLMVRRKNGGVIVNVASLLATHGGAGSAAYAASKAGVVGLTRSLAAELGTAGVRVNAVLPGYVESDMTRAMSDEARKNALSKIPAARFGTVDEVADAALFLATNTYANNCILNLDGGLSAV